MHIFYVVVTVLAALAYGYAASLNFVGAESVKVVADNVQVSRRWMVPFGMLLASGALGILIGFAVPALGVAAAIASSCTSFARWVRTRGYATAKSPGRSASWRWPSPP